jgi:hypothetical protein
MIFFWIWLILKFFRFGLVFRRMVGLLWEAEGVLMVSEGF